MGTLCLLWYAFSCREQCQSQPFLSYFCIAAMDLFRVYCWPAGNCLQLKQSKHVNQLQQNIKNVEQSSHINQLSLMCANTGDTQVSYSIPAYILLHMQRGIIWTTKGFLDHPMQRTCHYHGSLRCWWCLTASAPRILWWKACLLEHFSEMAEKDQYLQCLDATEYI